MSTAQAYNNNSIVNSIIDLDKYSIESDSIYLQISIAQFKVQSFTILQQDSNASFSISTNQILDIYAFVLNTDRLDLSTSIQFTIENRCQ